ncbi:hypothetical protein N9V90_02520, partial [Endozoicomonas sp.]|nr:hypothetical protein [Endozoicomonas sp.]
MSAQPLELPTISSSQAKLSRFLSCLQTDYEATIAGQPTRIKLSPGEPKSVFSYKLNLKINNTATTIELDSQAVSLFLPGQLDHNAVSILPADLLMGALHYTLTPTLQQAAQAFGVPVEIAGLTSNSSSPEDAGILMSANVGGT